MSKFTLADLEQRIVDRLPDQAEFLTFWEVMVLHKMTGRLADKLISLVELVVDPLPGLVAH